MAGLGSELAQGAEDNSRARGGCGEEWRVDPVGAGRGAQSRTLAGGETGASVDDRRGPHGEFPRNRMPLLPREDLSGDPPPWSPRLFLDTTFDRFVANFGHAAFLDAERRSGGSGLTSDKFANLLARSEAGDAPVYPEAMLAMRPVGMTVLHGYAARVASSGAKVMFGHTSSLTFMGEKSAH